MGKKFYITNAIPYVNAKPHIGFALEICQSDAIARYHRLQGDDTYFLMGADENSLKNVQAAEKAGKNTADFVKEHTQAFINLNKTLNISNDDFIKTSTEKHFKAAQKFWQVCQKDIYKKTYKGLYCVGCEEFKKENELALGCCPEHPKDKIEAVEEENYFFKLSAYQKKLEEIIEKDIVKIIPESRKNEALSFIKQGLEDFSISRTKQRAKGWGVPVPEDPDQVMYVWFDALTNYITALGYKEDGKLFKKYWQENENKLHVIGKGILKFHAVYWPAMLMSAGLPLPNQIFVHGYITVGGQKISKSVGNVIDPIEVVSKYGVDATRYYLLKEIPSTGDGDFSYKRFEEVYNSDLANGLGNLLQRTLTMVEKFKVKVEPGKKMLISDSKSQLNKEAVSRLIESFKFDRVLSKIWEVIKFCDRFIDENKPWELAKTDTKKLQEVLQIVCEYLFRISEALEPFMPETAQKMKKQLETLKPKPLFPKVFED